VSPQSIDATLAEKRFETARRIGQQRLQDPAQVTVENVFGLHDALVLLADFHSARELLEAYEAQFPEERFRFGLKLASDFRTLTIDGHYRLSAENRQGYTIDEYVEKYRRLAAEKFAELDQLARTPEEIAELNAIKEGAKSEDSVEIVAARPPGKAKLRGRIVHEDGSPAAHATVTLGLRTLLRHVDPWTYYTHHMHYVPQLGPVEKMTALTDATGHFEFSAVPPEVHDYLAVTLDPEIWPVPTRFLLRSLEVPETGSVDLGEIRITEWQSAPTQPVAPSHPSQLETAGAVWNKLTEWPLHNPFYYGFRRQLLRFPLPAGANPAAQFRVAIEPGQSETGQVSGNELVFLTDLPARTDRSLGLFTAEKAATLSSPLQLIEESPTVWRIDTGAASFRIAGNGNDRTLAPILALKGADQVWRGKGRLVFANGETVECQSSRILEQGPVFIRILIEFSLSGGKRYSLELTAIAGEPYLLAHECSDEIAGAAFEFSLREFSGGRGYLHWNGENGGWHWATLAASDEVIARLPESIPWWIPPQGFGYAMTPDGLDETDYLAVFSLRRGDWIDRKFERIANGPVDRDGRENREMDWPYPEMVGSSISVITAHTDTSGDVFFRFGMFDGERSWGLLASTLDQNDGPYKDLAAIQHANSSPRLQDFKDWHLDEPDQVVRPHVVLQRDNLLELRKKSRSPRFARLWEKLHHPKATGPAQGLVFAIEGDPAIAWRKRTELLAIAEIRARMTLLGRDWSDIYSPVGGRAITPWAEEYDLIAASGVFSPEEERQLRAFFILMGHMFMETDFMNWKFNGRNANFEADRVDIVAAIGLVFDGHPSAEKFLEHVIERTHKSLTVYCTPGSGKWYENPACYYLHASKCRMNLVYHLANHGRLDITQIPRLKEFLSWSLVLLTPEQPVSYAVMRDGGEAAYDSTEKIRKVPPVGDHAGVGRWLPEHYFFIGKLFMKKDPEFGQRLLDAYFLSNADAKRLRANYSYPVTQEGEQLVNEASQSSNFGNLALLFTSIEESDIPAEPAIEPVSRRLEGFGAVLRNRINTPQEDYVLIKQGPGGYRYQRTEGSFIFFADGKPLVYEGGEAGETWRHSTLSFHDVRMPMSAGRVERFFSHPSFQFVQGIHPEIIGPGKPVFLSDSCEHELVEECYRRYEKPNPAVVRAFAYVGSDYLVIHDTLDIDPSIPSHWHLQVAGEKPTGSGGNFEFKGRFGVDLQVLLPGQTFADEMTEYVPLLEYRCAPEDRFGLQHLQLRSTTAKNYLAVLRPLAAANSTRVTAEALRDSVSLMGTKVTAEGIADYLFFNRAGTEFGNPEIQFRGSYGASIQRPDRTTLWLGAPGEISRNGLRLRSEAAFALLTQDAAGIRLQSEGTGEIEVDIDGKLHRLSANGLEERSLS